MNKSVFGLDENLVAALSYLFGPFSGIVVLVMERENKFVRFHALQSTLWFLFLMITGWVLGFITSIPILGTILGIVLNPILFFGGILAFAGMIYLILRAYQGSMFKLPVIGDVVWTQVNK